MKRLFFSRIIYHWSNLHLRCSFWPQNGNDHWRNCSTVRRRTFFFARWHLPCYSNKKASVIHLCCICKRRYRVISNSGVSDSIECNQYGTELRNAFNNLKDRIGKTYGKPKINNRVDPKLSEFDQEDSYWFMTLKKRSRVLEAIWGEKTTLPDD